MQCVYFVHGYKNFWDPLICKGIDDLKCPPMAEILWCDRKILKQPNIGISYIFKGLYLDVLTIRTAVYLIDPHYIVAAQIAVQLDHLIYGICCRKNSYKSPILDVLPTIFLFLAIQCAFCALFPSTPCCPGITRFLRETFFQGQLQEHPEFRGTWQNDYSQKHYIQEPLYFLKCCQIHAAENRHFAETCNVANTSPRRSYCLC